jgi:putative phosphonate metabolism protein
MSARYALYYAPAPDTLFHALGSNWLGRDAWSGATASRPPAESIVNLTSEPRRYGFHATLKAPFTLAANKSRKDLSAFTAEFTGRQAPVMLHKLRLATLDGFLALIPDGESEHLHQLGACCVMDFDGFRGPLDPDEIARRHRSGLNLRQGRLLLNWGYPHVLDQFRFHITLSNKLKAADMARLRSEAEKHFAPVIGAPLLLDAITIFCEAESGAPFRAEERFTLAGKAQGAWPEIWKLGVR